MLRPRPPLRLLPALLPAAALLALPACARHRAPRAELVPVSRAVPVRSVAATPPPSPWAVPIALATDTYRRSGQARALSVDGFTVFPYGHGPASLSCAPLRACLVQLAPGETLTAPPIAGDTQRWAIEAVREGDGITAPLVVVKATDCDLSTNLVLATDRRMYQVLLEAPACRRGTTNPGGTATHVAFYFPDEPAPAVSPAPASAPRTSATTTGRPETSALFSASSNPTNAGSPDAPAGTNRRYAVRADKQIAWRPAAVYDDGARTVIELPASARLEELPVLYGLEDDGTRVVVNYSVSRGRYVADRVFRRAALVVRRGKAEQVIRIENLGPSRPGGPS